VCDIPSLELVHRVFFSAFTLLVITVFMLFVQKKDAGQVLLDKVFKHLELHEKDYFGLQFASVMPNVFDSVVSGALVM